MFDLQIKGGARFAYCVDFATVDYANISFFDAKQSSIPLHLSLRHNPPATLLGRRAPAALGHVLPRPQGLAVFNRRLDATWQREEPVKVSFLPGENLVELHFTPTETTVTLNGKQIFRLTAARCPLGLRFGGLSHQGGVLPLSLRLPGHLTPAPDRAPGELQFIGPFSLTGWGFAPGQTAIQHSLAIAGSPTPQDAISRPLPEIAQQNAAPGPLIGVQATLPGRIWQDLATDAPLQITLLCNDQPCGPTLSLTRAEACAQIEVIATTEGSRWNSLLALLALEHLRYGGFMAGLSKPAQIWAHETAEFYGLSDFLQAAEDAGPPPATEPDAAALAAASLETLRKDFSEALRAAGPTASPIALLPALPSDRDTRQQAYLVLTEAFCAHGDFAALFARAKQDRLIDFAANQSSWHNSTILPFLYAAERYDDLRTLMLHLATPQPDWIVTSTLSWVVQSLANDPPDSLTEIEREELIQPFLAFLQNRIWLYWERTPCLHLIRAIGALLAAKRLFSDDFYRWKICQTALQAYGLSPDFWAHIESLSAKAPVPLEGDLARAKDYFYRIAHHIDQSQPLTREDLARALRFFERGQCAEAWRFRIELLEGASLPPNTPDRLDSLSDAPNDPARAAMRHLAFPHLESVETAADAETFADLARQAVKASYAEMTHAPFPGLQRAVSNRIADGLAALAADPGSDFAVLEPLLQDLHSLAPWRSQALGLGLALVLLQGVLRHGSPAQAKQILSEIKAMRAGYSPEDLDGLPYAPAVVTGLYALRQDKTADNETDPIRKVAQALFPKVTAALPAARPQTALAQDRAMIFDTLVVVISCQPYLESRTPVLKSAWLDRLRALGIPYVVAVGGADGPARLQGDVLYLDAPDDYEGLPQKVLAAVDWVESQTDFGHMLKIDDDCFLDVETFFHSQSWRKFFYYGRKLHRGLGQLDRAWHCAKSQSLRGRFELDKSPEPSIYADGGSGYVLNRSAMAALRHQAATVAGQQLLRHSFMEDKAVGDLLAQAQITVSDEDYLTTVQRRTYGAALPVSIWVNSFWPSRASGVRLAHLDSAEAQPRAAAHRNSLGLLPHKVWPSFTEATLGRNANLLELVSPPEKLAQINRADLAVLACTRNEMTLLPQFLAHYRQMGVKAFLIADNLSDDGTLEYLAQQPDVGLFSVDSDYNASQYGVAWQQAILANFRLNRWSLVADIDEFLVTGLPGTDAPSLQQITAEADAEGADALRIFMLDLYPQGPLSQADMTKAAAFDLAGFCDAEPFRTDSPSQGPYGNSPTWTSALRHRLIAGSRAELFVAQKTALLRYRPWMRLSAGLHYVANAQLARRAMVFAHFKYHAEFRKKAQAEVNRRQHFNNAEEYRRYLALMSEGREVIYDPAVSVPWQQAEAVRAILTPPGA